MASFPRASFGLFLALSTVACGGGSPTTTAKLPMNDAGVSPPRAGFTCDNNSACVCAAGASCTDTCPNSVDCQYTCAAGSTCEESCPEGDCVQTCTGAACALTCAEGDCATQCTGGSCSIDCAQGDCTLTCHASQSCVITNCAEGNCVVNCNGAPDCEVDCPNGGCTKNP